MRNEKAPAGSGSSAERLACIASTNFVSRETACECRYRPERDSRQGDGADGCRLDAFLRRLRGQDRKESKKKGETQCREE